MITNESIVCISAIDWDFIWQSHQTIMATLAEQGNRVLFIDNTGVRPPSLRDLPRLRQRILNWWRSTNGFRQERENLFVYSPLILPLPYSRIARLINRMLLLRNLRRWMGVMGFRRPIIWTFLATPLALDLIKHLEPRLTIYHCADDFSSSSRVARKIVRTEERLFRHADLVFVTAAKLRERALRFRDQSHLFPSGVDFHRFERARTTSDGLPKEIGALKRPIAGYVGGIHKWVDQELLVEVAEQLPELSFAFVGPSQTDTVLLGSCRNVHLLGPKSHLEIPLYIKGFDVGLVPYRLNEYTECVYPAKLNEYLAMDVPVVATDLPEIRRFNAEHGGVVAVARDSEAFAGAICEAVGKNSPAETERRIEAARQNSWETRIASMSDLIEKALVARRSAGERWEESLRRVYRSARRRIVGTAAGVVAAYLLFFYTPLPWLLAEPLRIDEPPKRAQVIAVFGGGVGETGRPGANTIERARYAAELYLAGYASHIIFSSGYIYQSNDAENMKLVAMSLGVPAEAIILEQKANSAQQNVRYVAAILRQGGWGSALVVSSPYNMRRVSLVFNKWGRGLDVTYTPVPQPRFYDRSKGSRLEQLRAFLHEYVGILYYWLRGYI